MWRERFELARRLGRTEADISETGLSAEDFGLAGELSVEIIWQDNSNATFQYAFAIMSADGNGIGVFTEHCGYFVLQAAMIKAVNENTNRSVFHNPDA
jgi:hypothetical protein